MKLEFDYYYGQEVEQFTFYRIPKILFTSDVFHGLSSDANVFFVRYNDERYRLKH